MSFDTDVPPHKSAQPMDPPPADAERPNMAMLKADIDSGRTGDKVAVFDPGMAMLGTCEEAAGTPLTPEQVAIARDYETKQRWRLGLRKAGDAHGSNMALYAFGGFMVIVGAVFVGVFWMA
jgi:hypothetical protein